MVTSQSWGRVELFNRERWAKLFIEVLYRYRGAAYLLHEFVLMPDHFHQLITPRGTVEKAVQYIKGAFSHDAKKEFGYSGEIWQKGFSDHRIRDAADYEHHVAYIRLNPVRKKLSEHPEDYPFCSAHPGFELDEVPQRLKPLILEGLDGAAEAAPQQTREGYGAPEGAPQQSRGALGATEAAPEQRSEVGDTPQQESTPEEVKK
jgi:REP-associated tyrosine transposase